MFFDWPPPVTPPSQYFAEIVECERRRFFDDVLPSYLHRYYAGAGLRFLNALLRDLDAGRVIAQGDPPGRRAIRRAKGVAAACPVHVYGGDSPFVGEVLGRFRHEEHWKQVTRSTTVTTFEAREITLYEEPHRRLSVSGLELHRQVYDTLVHEFVHYFESFVEPAERILYRREHGEPELPALTDDEARRRDRWHFARKHGIPVLFFAAVPTLALGAMGALSTLDRGLAGALIVGSIVVPIVAFLSVLWFNERWRRPPATPNPPAPPR